MKTVLITKDDVLTAIETEPLHSGNWVSSDGCRTCVVGGTLRRKLKLSNLYTFAGFYTFRNLCATATEGRYAAWDGANYGNWLSALSIVWEYMNYQNRDDIDSPEDLRWNIWEWAEENIPDEWEYELVVQGGVA